MDMCTYILFELSFVVCVFVLSMSKNDDFPKMYECVYHVHLCTNVRKCVCDILSAITPIFVKFETWVSAIVS